MLTPPVPSTSLAPVVLPWGYQPYQQAPPGHWSSSLLGVPGQTIIFLDHLGMMMMIFCLITTSIVIIIIIRTSPSGTALRTK